MKAKLNKHLLLFGMLILIVIMLAGCTTAPSKFDKKALYMLSSRIQKIEKENSKITLENIELKLQMDLIEQKVDEGGQTITLSQAPVVENVKKVLRFIRLGNGGVMPIELIEKDGVFIGPKGERYVEIPSDRQLQRLYD